MLSAYEIPEWAYPIHACKGIGGECGWWLLRSPNRLRICPVDVRYCSLQTSHDDSHVWRSPEREFPAERL